MNREEAFAEINQLQDYYVNQLVEIMADDNYSMMKVINFTSPTGTGKTKMMGKLINKFPERFFIVTTLSKGQLHMQVRSELQKDCPHGNYYVYGSADYRINSRLDAEDIIGMIPSGKDCIWLRDEGHIATNRWDEILMDSCVKIINFSATNTHNDVLCNFTQTMMLRTVNQTTGTPEDAIIKLLEVKEAHRSVTNYNPCAIFRCIDNRADTETIVVDLCNKYGLKYINVTDEDFVMSELCEDDNEFDVILNKFKIVEGIDIRRAHVLYMDNQPKNYATTIQAIGRCRRNALLYRNDLDILAPENRSLLEQTRVCYIYYNTDKMKIDTDENGELYLAFCNHVSCESLKANTTITVEDGQLPNGLFVIELEGKTGIYNIKKDTDTGFNVVEPITEFYETYKEEFNKYFYTYNGKIRASNVDKLLVRTKAFRFNIDELLHYGWQEGEPYYCLSERLDYINLVIPKDRYDLEPLLSEFQRKKKDYSKKRLSKKLSELSGVLFLNEVNCLDSNDISLTDVHKQVDDYIEEWQEFNKSFCKTLRKIGDKIARINGSYLSLTDFFGDELLSLIQYYLLKQKKNGASNAVIDCEINRLSSNLEIIGAYKDKLNWNQILLHPAIYTSKIQDSFLCFMELESVKHYDKPYVVDVTDVDVYFKKIDQLISQIKNGLFVDKNVVINPILKRINSTEKMLKNNTIERFWVSYSSLFEPLNDEERYLVKKGFIETPSVVLPKQLCHGYKPYIKTVNDWESAIIGTDLMRQVRDEEYHIIWSESKSVSSKVGNHNKLNSFITNKYRDELSQAITQCFNGKNSFDFDTRCNSMIGYCVEYYSKYILYGDNYLMQNIQQALDEFSSSGRYKDWYKYGSKKELIIAHGLMDCVVVRACMLKYKEMMVHSFGYGVARVISSITMNNLVSNHYKDFVALIVELGTKTAAFVKETLYKNTTPVNDTDPNLSVNHIVGLADYITEDTILDVKVRNNIDEKCVRQVLAYHYLSTKRTDLHINRVIVYDATSDRSVVINISHKNKVN